MKDLREAVLQALAFTMRDFATVRDFEAAKAKLRDSLRAALDFDTGETTMHTTGPWTVDPKTLEVYAPDRHSHASAVLVADCDCSWLLANEIRANAGESPEWIRSRIAPAIARATGGQ